jgi:hypothetical protein
MWEGVGEKEREKEREGARERKREMVYLSISQTSFPLRRGLGSSFARGGSGTTTRYSLQVIVPKFPRSRSGRSGEGIAPQSRCIECVELIHLAHRRAHHVSDLKVA